MPDDSRDTLQRPSPDALLDRAEREAQGRLKIFLGAAPGVGKTYEMLMSGRARHADGVDVVIGVVETHGRRETQALLDGFEIIPRKSVAYRGQTLEEMDLDAILARRPALVLVDELAHTNAPGSRHAKRYMDVEELLARGIDVYSTLNIQHVESLNDVVAQITRVRVRETVPDSIIDRADEVEIIDITPADLIKRLHDGKVYVPQTARAAIENYFSPGNLTALRELALRRTAQRVDEQLLNHMQAHAISGPSFRLYPSDDRVGVQLGGALKNVLAIACGIVEGAGLGDSARAALIARGLAEMSRLVVAEGGRADTVRGLSGLGDLVLTATSHQSRNLRFGIKLGEGEPVDTGRAGGLVEGAFAASVASRLAEARGVEMPVTDAVAAIIDGRLDVKSATEQLMTRPITTEYARPET